MRAFDLTGRVAIITGAARGIGLGASRVLGGAGAHVVMADVLADQAQAAAGGLTADGVSCEAIALDVTDHDAVEAAVSDVVATHGRLDVMINNAGVIDDTTPMEVTEADLDRVLAVNFKGVVFGSQAAARVMIPRRSGSIINVTSGSVDVAIAGVTAYGAAKAASAHYSRCLAMELARHNVRVNTIAPGWVDTPMNERHVLRDDGSIDPERKAAYVKMRADAAPLGFAGAPEDQGYALLYLASDAARFVTGSVVRANGGLTMPW
jgi:3-oxoacyl-[acyl-carrier protein] reductase